MKNYIKFLFALAAFCTALSAYSQADQAAIKAVIEKETTAFFGVDSTTWKSCWLNAPYAYWAYSDSSGGNFVEGTKNIQKNFKEYFKTAKPSKSKIERTWLEIRIYGSGAYVRFIQKITDDIDRDETSEARVLEKENGKWKIVLMNAMARYPTK